MDRSLVKQIVDAALPKMQEALCLGDWTVEISVEGSLERHGSATLYPEYERVYIKIGADEMRHRTDIYDCLWHELLHGVASEYESILDLSDKMVKGKMQRVLRAQLVLAHEKTVRRLERVLKWRDMVPGLDADAKTFPEGT